MSKMPDIVEFLLKSGADVNITEDVDPLARPRDGLFFLSLTNAARVRLLDNSVVALLYKQWKTHKETGSTDFLTDLPTQEAHYEVAHMAEVGNGWALWYAYDSELPDGVVANTIIWLTGAEVVSLGLLTDDDGKIHPVAYLVLPLEDLQRLIDDGSLTDTGGRPITIIDNGSGSSGYTDGQSGGGGGTTDSDGNTISPPGPGSGTNGAPADGDISVRLNNCLEIFHIGPGAGGTSYANATFRGAIEATAVATGKFNPDAERLVSVNLLAFGRCYTGIFGSANLGPVTGPLGHPAQPLRVKDAAHNWHIWPFTDVGISANIEASPPDGVDLPAGSATLSAGARIIEGTVTVPMLPESEDIKLDGELPQLPGWLSWTLNTLFAAGPTAVVYLRIALCSFVKELHIPDCWKLSPHSNPVETEDDVTTTDCLKGNDPSGSRLYYPAIASYIWRGAILSQVYSEHDTVSVTFSLLVGSDYFDPTTGRNFTVRIQDPLFPSPHYEDHAFHVTGDYSGTNYENIPLAGTIDFPITLPAYHVLQFYVIDTSDLCSIETITLNEPSGP